MSDSDDMFDDPEPLDEDDPEVVEEMFEQYNSHELKPEDLPNMDVELKKKYAAWLESRKA